MNVLKILKWDLVEYIHIMIDADNLKYARSMIGATCVSMTKRVDVNLEINTNSGIFKFKELTDIMMGLNLDNPYTDSAAVELAIEFTKVYNKRISTRTNSNPLARMDNLNLVEYISIIESVKPKGVITKAVIRDNQLQPLKINPKDSPEEISRKIMNQPYNDSEKPEPCLETAFDTPAWYVRAQ